MTSESTNPVAEVRRAVRSALGALPGPYACAPLLVACSGGADSLALAAAVLDVAAAEAAARNVEARPVHAAVVDHGLQDGSAEHTAATVEQLSAMGAIAAGYRVDVAGSGGIEAAARRARYIALRAARPHPDSPVLLGHTLDDQAETVLLGLGRGSGPRSLAGMRGWDPPWLRPLLGVRRAVTLAACDARGLPVWNDPHNADPRFTRVRLRHEVLPLLDTVLAGGVAEALARTAIQLREDSEVLDALADSLLAAARDGTQLRLEPLVDAHPAVRRRALRAWMLTEKVIALTDAHLRAADVLAAHGPDRSGVALPGGLELVRARGRLSLRPVRWSGASPLLREDGHRVRR